MVKDLIPYNVVIYFDLSRFYQSTELTWANYASWFLHNSLCWQKPQKERKEIWSVYLLGVRQTRADIVANRSAGQDIIKVWTLESLYWVFLKVDEVRTILAVIYSLSELLTFVVLVINGSSQETLSLKQRPQLEILSYGSGPDINSD